ncbi:faciogenital dysplasia isoform X3 [Electrophorus electricus]|uniref:faciogenital dysplasia isoform X3 n=1 Tax=Electrophorus electricus TaxID=8005 RepID=UPI0015D09194|nr:faciogenital dysplasia isoform X3 [Electrophorus electricus]
MSNSLVDKMQGTPTTDLSPSVLQYSYGSVDLVLKRKTLPPPRPCHTHTVGKLHPQPATRKPASQKPQVPPKPAYLQAVGQDQRSVPPVPRRPLPIPPPKPQALAAQSVGILIEKFENARVPILGVHPRNPLRPNRSMEARPQEPETAGLGEPGASDPGRSCSTDELVLRPCDGSGITELPALDRLRINCTKDRASQENLDIHCRSRDSATNFGDTHGDQSDPDCNPSSAEPGGPAGGACVERDSGAAEAGGKAPNRDSGIDSPSCGGDVEAFPNEDPIEEEEKNDSIATETESVSCVGSGNKRDSTQDEDSDLDEGSSEEPECLESKGLQSESQKLFNIAKELLHTEEAYVKRLNLLDQVFCTKLTEAGINQEVITGIFSNISSIYCFHHQFLLPELQMRITQEWNTNPRIGDILQKLAPFMKMYGEYVKNFDRAMDLVNTWTQRSTQFKSVVQNIQKQDVCGNLTLQHHMLEPVQRIPRYELLLKDYLKKLPNDALDRKDTEKALDLISTAANHSNAAIRKMEKMHKLLEVYERLDGEEDIVNPANELIKEGHIKKMSAKNGTAQDRYLYLFNNMLLYCVPKLRLMGQKLSVRERIDITGLEVQENVKLNLPFTFTITGKQRSLELQARTAEEKEDWIQVITATIEKHKQNSETFNKAFNSSLSRDEEHTPDSPGLWNNVLVDSDGGVHERRSSKKRDKEKETCKGCNDSFHFTKRKHHCKNCGAAICGKCSKVAESKNTRMCRPCYEALLGPEGPPDGTTEPKKKAVTEKQLSVMRDSWVLCSHLLVQEKGKSWTKTWAAITKSEPLVLYLHTNSQDTRAARMIPLPGYEVSTSLSPSEKSEGKHVFKLSHSQHSLLFSAQDSELMAKWVELLSLATKGEVSDTSDNPTEPQKNQ